MIHIAKVWSLTCRERNKRFGTTAKALGRKYMCVCNWPRHTQVLSRPLVCGGQLADCHLVTASGTEEEEELSYKAPLELASEQPAQTST